MTKHYVDRKLINENTVLPTSSCNCSINSDKGSSSNMLFILILIALGFIAAYFIFRREKI